MRIVTFLLAVAAVLAGFLATPSSAEGLSAQLNLKLPKGYGERTPYVRFGDEAPSEYGPAKFDPITFSGWSTSFYGVSHHTRTKSSFNELHPGIGLRKHFGSCFFGHANCYAEATYIKKNSLNGETYSLGGGIWFHLADVDSYRIGLSESISYIKYKVPGKTDDRNGFIHMPAVTFGKDRWDLELGILTRDVAEWLKGNERAIYLLSINIKW